MKRDLDVNVLIAEYSTMNATALARKYGTSVWTILNRLRGAGIHIRSLKEQNEKRLNLSRTQALRFLEIVDGILLSDGYIDQKGCLRLEQSHAHAAWLEHVAVLWSDIGGTTKAIPIPPRERKIDGRRVLSKGGLLLYTPCYVELQEQRRRWYPKGKKRVPDDVILSSLSLAYWVCGDGTYGTQGAMFFCTNGFLKKEVQRLARGLSRLGVRARCTPVTQRHGEWYVSITRRDDALQLRTLTETHLPDCFRYKFRHVRASIPRGSTRAKLSPEQVAQIRLSHGTRQSVLAREFGVSQTMISNILLGKAHKRKHPT